MLSLRSRIPLFYAGLLVAITAALLAASPAKAQLTFSNLGSVAIPGVGVANPYPSTISISGTTGTITGIRITLLGLTHSQTDDIAALITGPQGQTTLLFDGAGNGSVSNVDLVFSDLATAPLPDADSFASGTYKPGQNEYGSAFDAPAPTSPYGTSFASYTGQSANGDYRLFVQDFNAGDSGSITGWQVTVLGVQSTVVPEASSLQLLPLATLLLVRRRISHKDKPGRTPIF